MREVGGPLLDRLALAAQRMALGERAGDVPSPMLGQGQTLAGHRPYVAGDDPRRIDQRAWARLDRPVVRTMRREREQRLHLVLDSSGSMAAPFPERFDRAREVAGALALLGLAALSDLRLSVFGSRAATVVAGGRGRAGAKPIMNALRAIECSGAGSPQLLAPLLHAAPRGLTVVVTDSLDPHPAARWVRALAGPSPTWVLSMEHPDDPAPAGGEVELIDPEDRRRIVTTLDAPTLGRARARLAAHRRARTLELRAAGIGVVALDVAASWEAALLGPLRAAGLVVAP